VTLSEILFSNLLPLIESILHVCGLEGGELTHLAFLFPFGVHVVDPEWSCFSELGSTNLEIKPIDVLGLAILISFEVSLVINSIVLASQCWLEVL